MLFDAVDFPLGLSFAFFNLVLVGRMKDWQFWLIILQFGELCGNVMGL